LTNFYSLIESFVMRVGGIILLFCYLVWINVRCCYDYRTRRLLRL